MIRKLNEQINSIDTKYVNLIKANVSADWKDIDTPCKIQCNCADTEFRKIVNQIKNTIESCEFNLISASYDAQSEKSLYAYAIEITGIRTTATILVDESDWENEQVTITVEFDSADQSELKVDYSSLTESPTPQIEAPANGISIVDLIKQAYEKGLFKKLKCDGRKNAARMDISGLDKDRLIGYFDKRPEFNREDNTDSGIHSAEFISDEFDIEIFDSFIQIYKLVDNEAIQKLTASDLQKMLNEDNDPNRDYYKFDRPYENILNLPDGWEYFNHRYFLYNNGKIAARLRIEPLPAIKHIINVSFEVESLKTEKTIDYAFDTCYVYNPEDRPEVYQKYIDLANARIKNRSVKINVDWDDPDTGERLSNEQCEAGATIMPVNGDKVRATGKFTEDVDEVEFKDSTAFWYRLTTRHMSNKNVENRIPFNDYIYHSLYTAKDEAGKFKDTVASDVFVGIEELYAEPNMKPIKTGAYWELRRGKFELIKSAYDLTDKSNDSDFSLNEHVYDEVCRKVEQEVIDGKREVIAVDEDEWFEMLDKYELKELDNLTSDLSQGTGNVIVYYGYNIDNDTVYKYASY